MKFPDTIHRACLLLALALVVDARGEADNAEVFNATIRPLLKEYCLDCHSTEQQKGELDLEPFSTLEMVRQHPKIWQSVAEQLANHEMPPKDKAQPSPEDKERLAKWVTTMLDDLARAQAGDPGPVVLRRLSNAEYTYTLRDLTGIESLDPAREFPVDGAAGEGFTNTGQALMMSPSMITKYLKAAKEIASHAVLLPEGIRFSAKTTRRDWTDEIVGQIRTFYREFVEIRGNEKMNVDGVMVETNDKGFLPTEKYLAATLTEREALKTGSKSMAAIASEHGLNAKYLAILGAALVSEEPSLLLDALRARWRMAMPGDAGALVTEIAPWQQALWKFSRVGYIGTIGGPKAWLEPVSPLTPRQELRLKIPTPPAGKEGSLFLVASDAGDGSENDFVVWENPRLVAPGRPDLLLRDVRAVTQDFARRRELIFASTAKCLHAASEASVLTGQPDLEELARKHGVDTEALRAWLDCLGIGASGPVEIGSHLRTKILKTGNYDFVKGWNWGDDKPPGLASNPTDQHLRVPGRMKPHSVAVHPSSDQQAAIGWRSPATVKLRVEASVTPGEPECGNGLTWSLELRRGAVRQRLATGLAVGGAEVKVGPIENLSVRPGDLVSLLVGSRDGNQSCDLAVVDFRLTGSGAGAQTWDLAADVSPNVHAGNPHADSFGNEAVWHFYAEPNESVNALVLPPGSLLAKWQSAASAEEKQKLADDLQTLLLSGPPSDKESPDAKLHEQLASFAGPLLPARLPALPQTIAAQPSSPESGWGLDPATFGRHPNGQEIDPASFCVRAPSVIEIRLPADLMAGCELVTTGVLEKTTGTEGSVQLQVLTTRPADDLVQKLVPAVPVVVNDGSAAFKRLESAFDSFRQTFPAALCYTQIVPVDEAVTARLFHRADEQLSRLMLDDAQQAKLDRLWDALHYVSHDAIAVVDALAQLAEYATSVGEFKFLDPLREPTKQRAAEFRQRLIDTQPKHLEALLKFTERAYRRPLTEAEKGELRGLYEKLRAQELAHEDAIRLTLARVLIAPDFLYRAEKPAPGKEQGPVSDLELATRLSYFLWSSAPDAELHASAVAGTLRTPETLLTQTRRMLGDPRARRLATEFACQWLHIHGFDTLDEKSERHFPTFGALRGAMYEESIRFFTDFLQGDRSVLSILDADHTFLNEALAHHYGIPGVAGTEWRRVEGVKKFARGGILGQGAPLAKQSGASRTSPILRGNWVAEVLLGDRLPRPPKGVPPLPEAEATESLTMRQLTEKHTTDPLCYGCHQRIDAFGFTLENFDAIGRHRDRDLGDRPINTRAKVMDGTEIEGIEGLRAYLLTTRRDAFLRQFCRKFLGYALGRSVQLSDEPLLTEMRAQLATNGFRVSTVIEAIVKSRQFLDVRGGEE